MHKLSKLSFLFSGISFVTLILGRLAYGGWHHLLWIPLAFFLGLFFVGIAREGRLFFQFFTMKTTKRGLNMGTMILLVLAILVLVNVIALRHSKTWDFSTAQLNTLSDQSLQLLKSLDSDLKVTFFYKQGAEGNEEMRRQFREMIKKYQDQTDRMRLDFVELNERPDLAEAYGVNKGSGVVFLEYKGRKNRIEKIDEQEITGALVKVTREKDKVLYFIVGHGEYDLDEGREPTGLNALKLLYENNRYTVKTLQLGLNPKIPDDADVVLIVSPQQNFFDHEIAGLESYLQRGGSLVLALKGKKIAGLDKLVAKYGIYPQYNAVLNVVQTVMGQGVNQGPTLANTFSVESDITKVFRQNEMVSFRFPMAIKIDKAPAGVTLDEIIRSPEASMAFADAKITGDGPVGAFTLAVSAKGKMPGADDKAKESMLLVFGDGEFLSNGLLYQNMNRDLALNMMAALSHEANLVAITPKEPGITKMTLTESKFSFFFWGFVLPLPLLLLSGGIGLWVRRRFA